MLNTVSIPNPAGYGSLGIFMEDLISSLMEANPKDSVRSMAKKVGLPGTTFERMAKRECAKPSFDNAVKVLSAARPGDEDGGIEGFAKKFYPRLTSAIALVIPTTKDLPRPRRDTEESFALSEEYELALMASGIPGLTKEHVLKKFGEVKGLRILDSMIGRKIVEERNGRVVIDGPISLSQDATYRLFKNLLSGNYDGENFGDKDNWLSVTWESVDAKKALPQINAVMREANEKIWAILSDPAFKGSDVVWAGLCHDTLEKGRALDENPYNKNDETNKGERR